MEKCLDLPIATGRFGTAKIRKFVPETPILPGRFRFPFSRERESAAGFHSRRLASSRLAPPRLASDRGRHFHKDRRRDARVKKPRETVLLCHVARDDRRVRLASVIERRAICSVIYASAACDRFPRSARSREEEKEEEGTAAIEAISRSLRFLVPEQDDETKIQMF